MEYKRGTSLFIKHITKEDHSCDIACKYKDIDYNLNIPFTNDASVHNAITCICLLLYLQIPVAEIAAGLLQLRTVAMRLELKQGINGCSIINDSYSSDINSMLIGV